MAEIINLRLARKARKRGEAERQAAENRAKFGQDKAAKARQRQEAERAQRTLDGARIGDGPDKSGE